MDTRNRSKVTANNITMKEVSELLRFTLIVAMIALPGLLAAQPDIDDDVLDNPVPFDGGVLVLVLSAVAYGLKKVNYRKKTETGDTNF